MDQRKYEETVRRLKRGRDDGLDAIDLANIAKTGLAPGFGPISFIAAFREAFGIPLNVLQEAHSWEGFEFGGSTIPDDEFKEALAPWIPTD